MASAFCCLYFIRQQSHVCDKNIRSGLLRQTAGDPAVVCQLLGDDTANPCIRLADILRQHTVIRGKDQKSPLRQCGTEDISLQGTEADHHVLQLSEGIDGLCDLIPVLLCLPGVAKTPAGCNKGLCCRRIGLQIEMREAGIERLGIEACPVVPVGFRLRDRRILPVGLGIVIMELMPPQAGSRRAEQTAHWKACRKIAEAGEPFPLLGMAGENTAHFMRVQCR